MSARRAIRSIYADLDDGFEIGRTEESVVRASRGDPTYGELTPAGVDRLLRALSPGDSDVFYDLGAGVGKVVLQVAMSVPVARCVGVELSASRCRVARRALWRARKLDTILARRCTFKNADMLEWPVGDATIVYSCSTAFSLRFMRSIVRKLRAVKRTLRFATLQELIDVPRGVHHVRSVTVPTTWQKRCKAHIYRIGA